MVRDSDTQWPCIMLLIPALQIALTVLSTPAATSLLAQAAPSEANIALARKYAPQFLFEKNEKYFGSSIEYFLNGPIAVC